MKIEQAQINKINLILLHPDERLKRIYLASEAETLGSDKEISEIFGIHQNTLTAGRKDPVVSIDCRKKENIGNYKNSGAEYEPGKHPIQVLDHDFTLLENSSAIPCEKTIFMVNGTTPLCHK